MKVPDEVASWYTRLICVRRYYQHRVVSVVEVALTSSVGTSLTQIRKINSALPSLVDHLKLEVRKLEG